jgi:hypothetical protein
MMVLEPLHGIQILSFLTHFPHSTLYLLTTVLLINNTHWCSKVHTAATQPLLVLQIWPQDPRSHQYLATNL